jgi:Kef-type K+ transport system membrane component KefB
MIVVLLPNLIFYSSTLSNCIFNHVDTINISKLGLIFAPLFFAIIGAQVDFRGLNAEILMVGAVIIGVAIATKLLGCGLPAWLFLRNGAQARKVGVAMISRGEVGLIVAGVGISSGVLAQNVYTMIVIMVAATTIITPIWLKLEYKKEMKQSQPK